MTDGRWAVNASGDQTHVVPVEDLEPHFLTDECHCLPRRHPDTDKNLVIHNSFDGRELTEPDRNMGKPN